MNHRIGRIVFALVVGLLVAFSSYRWITNPAGREERVLQESVVQSSRGHLETIVGVDPLEIVDPLSPNRKVGKAYVYPEGDHWAISGYYRRGETDPWHPYLMTLGPDQSLVYLKLKDPDQGLLERAAKDPQLEISP
ncbi:MAG: hypothetical protein GWP67_12840 [Gammaproteobacteria bacterium]|jgi:hypothetical protein|nr:hypothetical protein [Gammaproteobacteria bacterium]